MFAYCILLAYASIEISRADVATTESSHILMSFVDKVIDTAKSPGTDDALTLDSTAWLHTTTERLVEILSIFNDSWDDLRILHQDSHTYIDYIRDIIQDDERLNSFYNMHFVQVTTEYQQNTMDIFGKINSRQEQAIIVLGDMEFIVRLLSAANEIDIQLNQQAFFTFLHKWILVSNDECNMNRDYVGKISHVLCVSLNNTSDDSTTDGTYDVTKTDVKLHTSMYGNKTRYWQGVNTDKNISKSLFCPYIQFGLNKQHYRIGTMFWPGYIEKSVDAEGNPTFVGMYAESLRELSRYMNFTYDIIIPADQQFGAKDNGTWTGVVGLVHTRQVDFSIATLSTSPARKEAMDFADIPLTQTYVTGVYKKPEPDRNTISVFMLPFKRNVWLAILGTILLITVIHLATKWVHGDPMTTGKENTITSKIVNKLQDLLYSFELVFGTFLTQSFLDSRDVRRGSQRIILATFWFFSLLLVSLWSGDIISYLSVAKQVEPVKTLDDMLAQNDYTYGVLGGTLSYDNMRTSRQPREQQIWKNMVKFHAKDSIVLSSDHDAKIERVKQGGYIYIEEFEVFLKLASQHCDLTLMTEPFYPLSYSIGLPHNSAYKKMVNDNSQKLIESGIMIKLFRDYFLRSTKCSDETLKYQHNPVSLEQTMSVFVIFLSSVAVAFGVLVSEIAFWVGVRIREMKTEKAARQH